MADQCRSCRKPILWALTKTGKRMPVDAQPTPDGNLTLAETERGLCSFSVSDSTPADEPRYKSHFATCESAALFRRQGK